MDTPFRADRIVRSHTLHLRATPDRVFPLLCPTREYDWIAGWRCTLVHSASGFAEPDCVFKTAFPQEGPEDVWVVCTFRPPERIEFVKVNALRAVRFSIALTGNPDGTTTAEWTQVFTGLSPEGNRWLTGITEESFRERTALRERMPNHYLATGTKLSS